MEKRDNYTQIYVPWRLREKLRMVAKDERRTMVSLIELMLEQRMAPTLRDRGNNET